MGRSDVGGRGPRRGGGRGGPDARPRGALGGPSLRGGPARGDSVQEKGKALTG